MTPLLLELKKQISQTLQIGEWHPTELNLKAIALEISKARPETVAQLGQIVNDILPWDLGIVTEGVDNSDLRALLALATAAATKG